jgi:hypothetical protein
MNSLSELFDNFSSHITNPRGFLADMVVLGIFAFALILVAGALFAQLRQSLSDSSDTAGDGAADPYVQSLFHERNDRS